MRTERRWKCAAGARSAGKMLRLWPTLLVGLFLALGSASSRANMGIVITMPAGTKPTVAGLSLNLDTRWTSGTGYQPMPLTIKRGGPATSERTLHLELTCHYFLFDSTLVETDITIPAGSTVVSQTLCVPRYGALNSLSLDVYEDGQKIDGLSFQRMAVPNPGFAYSVYNLPATLFVTEKSVDVNGWRFFGGALQFGYVSGANFEAYETMFRNTAGIGAFAESRLAELPEGWLNYNSLDVIVLSLADVRQLARGRPTVWKALRDWTYAGGNLLIHGAGEQFQNLPEIEQLLSLPADRDQTPSAWERPDPELFGETLLDGNAHTNNSIANELDLEDAVDRAEGKKKSPPPPMFTWRAAGFGRVVAIGPEKPLADQMPQWRWLFNSLQPARWKWNFRHGVSFAGGNSDFNNFLIADIGLPPVRAYRVLISVFVLTIGPLNYWWLRRKGRLHLLLFTVPAAALLVSGTLLGYVVVADGFESRLRSRSVTLLDQQNRHAASWARLSYYTGLAPSSGLVFPADCAVLPLQRDSESMGLGFSRTLGWYGDQHLTRGWLPSRTPTQYLTVRSYESRRELAILPANDAQTYLLRNRLGTPIRQVLVSDPQGKLYFAEGLGVDQEKRVAPLATEGDVADALAKLLDAIDLDSPRFPKDMPYASSDGGFSLIRSRRRILATYNQDGFQGMSTSLLEVEIEDIKQALRTAQIPPRSYIAIVERPQEIVVGLDPLKESQSLHIIRGTW